MKAISYLLIGGGTAAVGGAIYLAYRSSAQTSALRAAVDAPPVALPASPAVLSALPTFQARTTGYWPFSAREDEKKMEGGTNDRMGKPLYTLEQHLAGRAPYVSVSGDPDLFPYGQRLTMDQWPGAIFRVVDTGSHFHGAGKVYRMVGYEPLDVCVDSSATIMPKTATAQIVPGDHFAKKGLTEVATGKFKGQTVAGSAIIEGRTGEDREALARFVQGETGGHSRPEQLAAAWTIRNRADKSGMSVRDLLVARNPRYNPTGRPQAHYAATPVTYAVADQVLEQPASFDPTGGAVEFWMPELQATAHLLGAVHRAAVLGGDADAAGRFAPYANYGSVENVRRQHARRGLQVLGSIGAIEILGGRS